MVLLCRQSCCQLLSFWQCIYSRTIMLKVWPECFDHPFSMCNISNYCNLLHLGTRFLQCSTYILARLPHHENVVDCAQSVQFAFLHIFLQFQLVFSFSGIKCFVISCQLSRIGLSKLSYYDFVPKGIASHYKLSPADTLWPKWGPVCHSYTICNNEVYVVCRIQ